MTYSLPSSEIPWLAALSVEDLRRLFEKLRRASDERRAAEASDRESHVRRIAAIDKRRSQRP